MQTLPANGQAQTLPAKWVIKRTPGNAEMVNKWANENCPNDRFYNWHNGYIHSCTPNNYPSSSLWYESQYDGFTLITDSQFKAMVEGEEEDRPIRIWKDDPKIMAELEIVEIKSLFESLIKRGHADLADQLKAKHPDIWPVDYAAIVLEKAVAFTKRSSNNGAEVVALHEAVRNYLTNQK